MYRVSPQIQNLGCRIAKKVFNTLRKGRTQVQILEKDCVFIYQNTEDPAEKNEEVKVNTEDPKHKLEI